MPPLTPATIDSLLQTATIAMGMSLTNPGGNTAYGVRIGWQTQGQPAQLITDDVVYLRALEVDDPYNRIKDRYSDGFGNQVTEYTRVWEVYWTVYGPNSFDNARILRTRLFDQDIHDALAQSALYFVTDPRAPVRNVEEKDGQWWERCDFSARFNEFTVETAPEDYALSTEIVVYDQFENLVEDVTVSPGLTVDFSMFGTIAGITVNSQSVTATGNGTVSVVAPLASGDLLGGAVLEGGLLTIVTASQPQMPPSATFVVDPGATWTKSTQGNGTHFYTIAGTLNNGAGSFTAVSANVGSGNWPGSAAIASLNLTLNIAGNIVEPSYFPGNLATLT